MAHFPPTGVISNANLRTCVFYYSNPVAIFTIAIRSIGANVLSTNRTHHPLVITDKYLSMAMDAFSSDCLETDSCACSYDLSLAYAALHLHEITIPSPDDGNE